MIGNAVPPLVGEAVGEEILRFLAAKGEDGGSASVLESGGVPRDESEAIRWLQPILEVPAISLRKLDDLAFRKAWYAVAYIYSGLHPDSALDHGDTIRRDPPEDAIGLDRFEPRLLAPFYERSGWPVVLAPLAREAWRRYTKNELEDDEFYCVEAQVAGIRSRVVDFKSGEPGDVPGLRFPA